jgi:hypothetical protein
MKQLINNHTANTLEFFTRFLYSFQVLIIGIALPFLFMIGISTKLHSDPAKTEIKAGQGSELTAKPTIELKDASM